VIEQMKKKIVCYLFLYKYKPGS